MTPFELTMLSPVPAYQDEADTSCTLAARPATLDGKVVGLLPNWRPSAAHILKAIGEALQKRYQLKEIVFEQPVRELPITKGKVIDSIRDRLEQLRSRVDVVVTATGD
jgi:hypothetical protein